MSDSPVRFGLVGYGLFGKHHASLIDSTAGAELACIAVRSSESQQAASKDFPNVDVVGDYRQLLTRPDVDVVDVVVPNNLHFEVAEAALKADNHLLLEKPMALSVGQCDRLLTLSRDRRRIIAINHELRHSPLWGEVKQLIDAGKIGTPKYSLVELSRFPYRPGSQEWRWDRNRVGNWILEEPIHFFDLARWYLSSAGEPVSVYARANSRQADRPGLCDNFSAVVNHTGGAYAVISQTLAAFEHHVTAKIAGAQGTIWAHWSAADARSDRPTFALRYGLGDDIHEVEINRSTGELLELADQIAMMVRCVNYGELPLCTGEDGRWSTLLCLAAQRSVETGNIVPLETFAGD